MFKQTKGFMTGIIIGVLLATSLSVAFAAPIEQTITAFYNDIKIYIDGVLIMPKDVNGNKVEPFIYNGTTYLPVRSVGEAFGKSVSWDGNTNSVYIGKNNTDNPAVLLGDLDWINLQTKSDSFYKKSYGLKDSTGNIHENAILIGAKTWGNDIEENTIFAEYVLNQKYSSFKGSLIIPFDTRSSDDVYNITFLTDDNQIYKSPNLTAGTLPISFDVNVSGALKFTIKIVRIEKNAGNSSIGIVNAGFYD